jgi:hypothetical protein
MKFSLATIAAAALMLSRVAAAPLPASDEVSVNKGSGSVELEDLPIITGEAPAGPEIQDRSVEDVHSHPKRANNWAPFFCRGESGTRTYQSASLIFPFGEKAFSMARCTRLDGSVDWSIQWDLASSFIPRLGPSLGGIHNDNLYRVDRICGLAVKSGKASGHQDCVDKIYGALWR